MLDKRQSKEKAFATMKSRLREVLECDDKLMDLKAFNIIIIPMLENRHYYLICFDLENEKVEVIDNMVSNKGLYTMRVGTKFSEIGSPCKVVCF